ncbi:protein of unassigned function [Methylobacterium oryzae CBMB20]|uniref:Protein of unassigned function n=2 Tax=Methylobacterium TaxID=407 RepID=A0A089P190_9HYPH|nr:protein of unassigned function [Methylobacterium oryzae CBMB20]
MKTGALQWICRRDQTCSIDCATAPPKMHCHDPELPRRAR